MLISRIEKLKSIVTVDTKDRYSNEAGRSNQDIYDDFKLFLVSMVYRQIFQKGLIITVI